jgi:hypothetical protein
MANPASYRRIPYKNRPWIRGKLFDDLRSNTVLHLDAYVLDWGALKYLVIEYREGGRELLARDTYAVNAVSVTPQWGDAQGRPGTWNKRDHATYRRAHALALARADECRASGRWGRVDVLCHYVGACDVDTEPRRNITAR